MDNEQSFSRILITEPKVPTAKCVMCHQEIAIHEAYPVTVEVLRPWSRRTTHTVTFNPAEVWQTTWSSWSAAQQAMLTGPSQAYTMPGSWHMPEPTHERISLMGWACSREHAESAAEAKCWEYGVEPPNQKDG